MFRGGIEVERCLKMGQEVAAETHLGRYQTSMMNLFCENSQATSSS